MEGKPDIFLWEPEEGKVRGCVVLASNTSKNEILHCSLKGQLSGEELESMMEHLGKINQAICSALVEED